MAIAAELPVGLAAIAVEREAMRLPGVALAAAEASMVAVVVVSMAAVVAVASTAVAAMVAAVTGKANASFQKGPSASAGGPFFVWASFNRKALCQLRLQLRHAA
jgi:hypothetical protein